MENIAQIAFNIIFLGTFIYWFFFRKKISKSIMAHIIDNDPYNKKTGDIHRKARARLEKEDPELLKLLDKYE